MEIILVSNGLLQEKTTKHILSANGSASDQKIPAPRPPPAFVAGCLRGTPSHWRGPPDPDALYKGVLLVLEHGSALFLGFTKLVVFMLVSL